MMARLAAARSNPAKPGNSGLWDATFCTETTLHCEETHATIEVCMYYSEAPCLEFSTHPYPKN